MPAGVSTVTVPPYLPGMLGQEGASAGCASLLTFRFYIVGRGGLLCAMPGSFYPQQNLWIPLQEHPCCWQLAPCCSDMEKGYFPPPTLSPTLSRGVLPFPSVMIPCLPIGGFSASIWAEKVGGDSQLSRLQPLVLGQTHVDVGKSPLLVSPLIPYACWEMNRWHRI